MTESGLTHEDFQSATWRRLVAHLTARVQSLRELNDGRHPEIRTTEIRSSISECKRILALRPAPSASVATDPFAGVGESAEQSANDE
jgi:hypothetical protein